MIDRPDDDIRELAIKRLKQRRELWSHLVTYLVVNIAVIAVWAVTGQGYFWPGWVVGGWGIGLVLHAWNTLVQRPISNAEVDEEIDRLRRRSGRASA